MHEQAFDFDELFVFDLANNHQGSVEHGLKVIREVGGVANKHGGRAAFKFQFRQLDSFIHLAHREGSDNKHIPRFLSTRLDRDGYQTLLDEVRNLGLLAMCTPFDEESVDVIVDMGFDILKIASCSAADWPLLEKAANAGLPMVCSTGGLDLVGIDALNSFLTHRGADFALMHCVSIYPTPAGQMNLDQIEMLCQRYPGRAIGWSTHEDPDDLGPVQIAVAKGAKLFERHVGCETDDITLNAYSSTPEQVDKWIAAYLHAKELCGAYERPQTSEVEAGSILSLRRGVYARKKLPGGQAVGEGQVYFAMPCLKGQIDSSAWRQGAVVTTDVAKDEPVMAKVVDLPPPSPDTVLKRAVHEVKAILNMANVVLDSEFTTEYSHHYGLENFARPAPCS